jgi:pterin-4a-carbinolamine dehydratase
MNENLIFISYRRSNTAVQAVALRLELEMRLKAAQVFLDTRAISPGAMFPDEIKAALDAAKVILALVGDNWAGRRPDQRAKIYDEGDWVRHECRTALARPPSDLLPLLVDNGSMPEVAELPDDLRRFPEINALKLRSSDWDADVQSLTQALVATQGFEAKSSVYRYPTPDPLIEQTIPVDWLLLQTYLREQLSGWSIEFSDHPDGRYQKRISLIKNYQFHTFDDVIRFTSLVGPQAKSFNHHPVWMQVWKTLTVWLTTWDAGHRVTLLDLQFAKYLDQAYREFPADRKPRRP